jgi:hypothetical protein
LDLCGEDEDAASRRSRTVTVDHTFRVYDGDDLLTESVRTTSKPIARFKVCKPEPARRSTGAQ